MSSTKQLEVSRMAKFTVSHVYVDWISCLEGGISLKRISRYVTEGSCNVWKRSKANNFNGSSLIWGQIINLLWVCIQGHHNQYRLVQTFGLEEARDNIISQGCWKLERKKRKEREEKYNSKVNWVSQYSMYICHIYVRLNCIRVKILNTFNRSLMTRGFSVWQQSGQGRSRGCCQVDSQGSWIEIVKVVYTRYIYAIIILGCLHLWNYCTRAVLICIFLGVS